MYTLPTSLSKPFNRALALAWIFMVSSFSVTYAQSASSTQIWFSPRQDNVDMTQPPGRRVLFTKFDFPNLLAANAPWQTAAKRLSLLTIGVHTIEQYNSLPSVVDMTNRYDFNIATAGGMVYTEGLCGKGMEGLDSGKEFAGEIVASVKKWKRYGGRLDFVFMDSPFYFGYYASAKSCHYSIAEVARRAAATFKQVQKVYPIFRVMDAEGPGSTPVATWLPAFKEWLDDFKTEANHSIDAVGMDLHWEDTWHTGYDWIDAARQTTNFLHEQGIIAGLYINANDKGMSNSDWMDLNRKYIKAAARSNIDLDFVYLASWMSFPVHNLPETDPDAYTSLVNDAFRDFGNTK